MLEDDEGFDKTGLLTDVIRLIVEELIELTSDDLTTVLISKTF